MGTASLKKYAGVSDQHIFLRNDANLNTHGYFKGAPDN
jgi:hypothetical protein